MLSFGIWFSTKICGKRLHQLLFLAPHLSALGFLLVLFLMMDRGMLLFYYKLFFDLIISCIPIGLCSICSAMEGYMDCRFWHLKLSFLLIGCWVVGKSFQNKNILFNKQKKGRKRKLRDDEIVCPTSKQVYKWRPERKLWKGLFDDIVFLCLNLLPLSQINCYNYSIKHIILIFQDMGYTWATET